jgi:hypothetical protein
MATKTQHEWLALAFIIGVLNVLVVEAFIDSRDVDASAKRWSPIRLEVMMTFEETTRWPATLSVRAWHAAETDGTPRSVDKLCLKFVLRQRTDLFAPGYREHLVYADDKRAATPATMTDVHCHYTGAVVESACEINDDPNDDTDAIRSASVVGAVRLSACVGFHARYTVHGAVYDAQPAASTENAQLVEETVASSAATSTMFATALHRRAHVVRRLDNVYNGAATSMALAALQAEPDTPHGRHVLSRLMRTQAAPDHTIDIVIVNGPTRRLNLVNAGGAEVQAATLANLIGVAYDASHLGSQAITIRMVAQLSFVTTIPSFYVFSDVDGATVVNAEQTLFALADWQKAEKLAGRLPANQHVLMLTDRVLDADRTGAAISLSMCASTDDSTSLYASTGSRPLADVALTAAHEMAHTMGLGHVGPTVTGSGKDCNSGVMSVAAENNSTWSECSRSTLTSFLLSSAASCIDTAAASLTPPAWDAASVARCSDGFISGSEQCDCGSSDCSQLDACCDGATCRFTAGSTCTLLQGPCCRSTNSANTVCTLYTAAEERTCRAAVNEGGSTLGKCDVAEVCSGGEPECPPDINPKCAPSDDDGFFNFSDPSPALLAVLGGGGVFVLLILYLLCRSPTASSSKVYPTHSHSIGHDQEAHARTNNAW